MGFDLNGTPSVEDSLLNSNQATSDNESDMDSVIKQLKLKLMPGQVIEGLDAAYILYCEYARLVGFSVRKGSQNYFRRSGEMQTKLFHCSCEGVTDTRAARHGIPVYKKHQRRTSCRARLRINRESRDGQWKVVSHQSEHNHELYQADQAYLLRSVRNLSHAQKSIIEQMHAAGIGVSKACRFMENESNGVQNTGFIRKDAYDHMNRIRAETKIANGDANAILEMFAEKNKSEPFFYSDYMLDDEGRLMNFFFRDSQCAADYDLFGDVLSVDTTFKTNKYNLICAPFVGLNHHRQNVMFGLGFLSDESARSFKWLFSTFIRSMLGVEPKVVFSDQCQALMNAVDECFKTARHRLCQWHVNQNAPAHFGIMKNNIELKKMWYRCMSECETEKEFEDTWRLILGVHDFAESPWFETMYKLRRRWADVFTNETFSVGMHATSRSEVTNKVLKDLCVRSCTLTEFIRHYEQIQLDWRNRERAEDALCIGMPGQLMNGNHLLTHASRVYTRNVYWLVEAEAAKSMNVDIIQSPNDYACPELEFILRGQVGDIRSRRVSFQPDTQTVKCSCRLWETSGIFCRHIFKVLLHINVRRIPEQHILNWWTRTARHRSPNNIITPSKGDIPGDKLFVNNIMRLAYAVAQNGKDNESIRDSIRQFMTLLYNQVCGAGQHGWYPTQRDVANSKVSRKKRKTKHPTKEVTLHGSQPSTAASINDQVNTYRNRVMNNHCEGEAILVTNTETETESMKEAIGGNLSQYEAHNLAD